MCVVSEGVSKYLGALEAPGPPFNMPGMSVLLWLLQPHFCLEGTDIPLPLIPSHAHLLLGMVLLSHETLAALSCCFVAQFCKSGLMESVPSTTEEETSAPLSLYDLLLACPTGGLPGS